MTISEEQKSRILEEIIQSKNFRTELKEGEFTKAELLRKHGITKNQADILIKDLLAEGHIKSRPALNKGKPCIAYSFEDGSELTFNS